MCALFALTLLVSTLHALPDHDIHPDEIHVVVHDCLPYIRFSPPNRLGKIGSGIMMDMWDFVRTHLKVNITSYRNISLWTDYIGNATAPYKIPTVFLSCTTITPARAKLVAFAYPLVTETIVLMSVAPSSSVTLSNAQISGFAAALLWYMVLAILFGLLFFLGEYHRMHKDIPVFSALVDSIYFSFITTNTVGFGDITPITKRGRGMVIIWIFLTTMIMGVITAILLDALEPTTADLRVVTDPLQLVGARVGCLLGSVQHETCKAMQGVTCVTYLDNAGNDMVNMLVNGRADFQIASLYQAVALRGTVKNVQLMYHPYVLSTSSLAFLTQVEHAWLAEAITKSIGEHAAEFTEMRQSFLDAGLVASGYDPPTLIDLMGGDLSLYISMGILGAFVLFFAVGGLISICVCSDRKGRPSVVAPPAPPPPSIDGEGAIPALLRRLFLEMVDLYRLCGTHATVVICLGILSAGVTQFKKR